MDLNVFSVSYPPRHLGRQEDKQNIAEEATGLFDDHYYLLNKSLHSRKLHLEGTPSVLEKLNHLWRTSGSEKVLELVYHLTICYHLYRFDYHGIIDFGIQFQEELAKSQIIPQPLTSLNNNFMAYACLKIKDYKRGLQLAQSDDNFLSVNRKGEISFLETTFILSVREKQYLKAETISVEALKKSGKRENSLSTLRWKILQGYLRLVSNPDNIRSPFEFKTIRAAVGQLSGGPSLLVLLNILEFSYLLAVQNTVDAAVLFPEIDSSFKKYRTINQVETRRLEWFRGFLFTLIKNDFDIQRMNPSAIKILDKLKTKEDPYSHTEIISFYELGKSYLSRLGS